MWSAQISRSSFFLLNVAAYITLVTVAIPTVAMVPAGDRLWVAALLAIFGMLVTQFQRRERGSGLSHVYLLLQAAVVAVIIWRFPTVGLAHVHLLFFVLSAYATLMLPLAPALLWIAAFFLFTMAAAATAFGWMHALGMLAVAGGHALFGSFGALLRQSEEERRQSERLLEELRSAHRQLQAYAAQAEQLAVAEERNRLAREMHDALGHRLTVAVVQLEGAQRLIPQEPERAAGMVGAMREELKTALGELRRTVAALRQAPEVDRPLSDGLQQLAQAFEEATGVQVLVSVPQALPALPEAVHLALYRAAQEGLTNVQRHAGARTAWLTLRVDGAEASLTVADDGRGVAQAALEHGADGSPSLLAAHSLRGLRERAAQLDGEVQLVNRPEGGAELTLRLPWARQEAA